MRAGDGSEDQDQHREDAAGRERVAKQRDTRVPGGKRLRHDTGPDDHHEQKGGAEPFDEQPASQIRDWHRVFALLFTKP